MRYFNTSGPNNPKQHYTIERTPLIKKGQQLVAQERYFTIWAPRQTGKSTYFRQLAGFLEEEGYKVAHTNLESLRNAPLSTFLEIFASDLDRQWGTALPQTDMAGLFHAIEQLKEEKLVLIIDEVEGVNEAFFGDFLHSIRRAYHSRHAHGLKSVILVGVTNILGVVSDNASPFNIADNLDIPYFSDEEVQSLLHQHESETGQRFAEATIRKVSTITANQPGLVNGFAAKLVEFFPDRPVLDEAAYLEVEDWYLRLSIDKNFENIHNKAKEERKFVERLLFTEDKIPFKIDRPSIKYLHTNGLIRQDEDGFVTFWVPFYKKRLYDAFYPYTNGEQKRITRSIYAPEYFTPEGGLHFEKLIAAYKAYVKRRGFAPFREKDADGNYKSIREAALIYSFETYIHAIVEELSGKIYREADTGLGKSDMIINIRGQEFVIETKVYYSPGKFESGKRQLAYYCQSLGLTTGLYLVFCPNNIAYPDIVREGKEDFDGTTIKAYIIPYDEERWD
jgi:hypothetical protein